MKSSDNQMHIASLRQKVEELRRQVRATKEDASRYRIEVDKVTRAATANRSWTKEELEKKNADIRKLAAENDYLRRVNKDIEMERDEKIRAYRDLAKQNAHYRSHLERLKADNVSLTPTESEIRQNTESPLGKGPHTRYRQSVQPHSDVSPAASPTITPGSIKPIPQSTTPFGRGSNVLAASLPIEPVPSDSNSSPISRNVSPIPTSKDTQPVPRRPGVSPVPTSVHTSSVLSGLPEDSVSCVGAGSLALRLGQVSSPGQNARHEDPLIQSPLSHRYVEKDMDDLSKGKPLAEISSRYNYVEHGRRSLSRRTSDVSMQSASEPASQNEVTAEEGSNEQAADDSSDSSSIGTDDDSDDDSDEDSATSRDASEEARKDTDSGYPPRAGSKAPEALQHRDSQQSPISRGNKESFQEVPPALHQQKAPAGRSLDSPRFSTDATPTASNAGSYRARSSSTNEVPSGSRTSKQRSPYNPVTPGSRSSTILVSNAQTRSTQATSATCPRAVAGQRSDRPIHQSEEETDVGLKAAIRESYTRFGLDAQRIRFCYEPQPLDPTAINLNTNWKRRSKLNESVVEKLLQVGIEMSAFLPESDNEKATKKETDLIRRLCNCNPTPAACSSLREIVGALRRERDVTKDELNLIEFELYSTLIVMKSQSEREFEETVTVFSDYQCNLLGMYNSLHMFLAHLNEAWQGLHLLVLIYLLRVGAARLLKYLVSTTRPAAIELLLQIFGKPELMAKHRKRVHHLVSLCGPVCTTQIQQVTPLRRLQGRMAGVVEPSIVSAALGYSDQYQSDAGLDTLRTLHSTTNTIPNYPRTIGPTSQRQDAYNSLGGQDTIHPASDARAQNTETPCPTPLAERTGLRKSVCIDPHGEEGGDGTRPLSKRRCGVDRTNGYDTGRTIDAAVKTLSEGPRQRTTIQPPAERLDQTVEWPGAVPQGDSGYDALADEAMGAIHDSCTNLHIAADSGSSWTQMPPLPMDGYMQVQTETQAAIDGNYPAEATGRTPNLDLYDPWFSDIPQGAPPSSGPEAPVNSNHWNSLAPRLSQDLIASVEDGTVDPRAIELRS